MVSAAARAGKSRTALWNLLSKHHLHPSQFVLQFLIPGLRHEKMTLAS